MTVTRGTITHQDPGDCWMIYHKEVGFQVTEQSDQDLFELDIRGVEELLILVDNIDDTETLDVSIDWTPDSTDSTIWQNIVSIDDLAAGSQDFWILTKKAFNRTDALADPHYILPPGAQKIRVQVQSSHETNACEGSIWITADK